MGMGFAPTWLRQVSPPPLLHKTTLTTGPTFRLHALHPLHVSGQLENHNVMTVSEHSASALPTSV